MDGTVAIDHHVAFRAERAAQADGRVQVRAPVLREANDLEALGATDLAFIGREFARKELEQRGFAAAVGTDKSDANAGRKGDAQILEQTPSPECLADSFGFNQTLGLAVGGGEIDFGGATAGALVRSRKFVDKPAG